MATPKWIVLDGLTSQCSDVTAFTRHVTWRVVVVVHTRRHHIAGCSFPRCTILTGDNQMILLASLSLPKMVKTVNRMSGYLYAMQQGADTIWESTCDESSAVYPLQFFFDESKESFDTLFFNDTRVFDPSEHYGYTLQPSRTFAALGGYGDNWKELTLKSALDSQVYYLARSQVGFIHQGVSGCPARCDKQQPVKDRWAFSSTPVSVGIGTLGVLDSGPTVFQREVFPWLFLPADLPGDLQPAFRALFVHGLRAATNTMITYFPDDASSICLCDAKVNETPINHDVSHLTEFLNSVGKSMCVPGSPVSHCMMDLLLSLTKIMERANQGPKSGGRRLALLGAWLGDMVYLGFFDAQNRSKVRFSGSRLVEETDVAKITFTLKQSSLTSTPIRQSKLIAKNVFNRISTLCANFSIIKNAPMEVKHWKMPMISDVLLVVVINYESLFESVFHLEYVHRPFFRHILYCGPNVDHFRQFAKKSGLDYISYLEGLTKGWEVMYECAAHAMRLGAPVRGYLQVGDDTLINTGKLLALPRDQVWMPAGHDLKDLYLTTKLDYWQHWGRPHGRQALIRVFQELHNVSQDGVTSYRRWNGDAVEVSPQYRSFAKRFLKCYDKNVGLRNAVHRAVDFFYIPQALKSDFLRAAHVFRRHGSMIEMAIPTIAMGLVPSSKIRYVKPVSLWRGDRDTPWKFYDVNATYLHPFKPLADMKKPQGRHFFCETFLPHLFGSFKATKR